MADNVGATWASDDVGGAQHLRVKACWGADGTVNDPSVAAPVPVQASGESNQMTAGGTVVTPKFAAIAASGSGDNTIVALVSGKKIRVLNYVLVANGTVNVKWKSSTTTDKTGLAYLVANTGVASPHAPTGLFETAAGEALVLNLSAAIAVGGHLSYIEV